MIEGAPHPQPPQSAGHDAPPQRSSALLGVVVTSALVLALLALLFYRGMTTLEPEAKIIVRANKDWHGAELIVDGGDLTEPRATTMSANGNYVVPFFLSPGHYTLHVKSQGVEVFTRDFDLTTQKIQEADLLASGASTRPATTTVSE